MTLLWIVDGALPGFSPVRPKRREVEAARRSSEALLEATREIRGRSKSAGKGYVGEREAPLTSPLRLPDQAEGTFEPQPFHELVKRFADQRPEDSMKVERRETRRPGD